MSQIQFISIEKILKRLASHKRILVSGLFGSSKSLFVHALTHQYPQVIFITQDENINHFHDDLCQLEKSLTIINDANPYYLKAKILITSPYFLKEKICEKEPFILTKNKYLDIKNLVSRLQTTGYTREDIVEEAQEYAQRGGIIDIYEPEEPLRIELYDDKIHSLRRFNIQTQRSTKSLSSITLFLAKTRSGKTLFTLKDPHAIIIADQGTDIDSAALCLSQEGDVKYDFVPGLTYFGDLNKLKHDIMERKYDFKFFIGNNTLADKLNSILGPIHNTEINLTQGFIDRSTNTVYLTETDIFGTIKRKKQIYRGLFIDDLMGLKKGDYVVHADYGIGQFNTLCLMDFENRKIECLCIDYAGNDRVYLPVEKMNLLERYVATHENPPRLSKLGSEVWLRVKNRAQKATERLAINLLNLYTRRAQEKGYAFAQDTEEMALLEASFPYEETPDQKKAIHDVKIDMATKRPAERLICGDVGYGKTEIALRAGFKAALENKQTMILCPTTLLALQHYTTFRKRLEPFPVNVDMVSRFRDRAALKNTLRALAAGAIDIVIGTHRLLMPDVHFKDLALLIIDEEQRFGVAQKEKIRNLQPGIDTFYLSATPIPRTLYMGLTGLKDISNIYTPPPGRKDIVTHIIYYDEEEIRKIIKNELARNGQVLFIHNRVQTIETVKARLLRIVPDLKICLLHGQMKENITERRMVDFLEGKYEMLLSTAIVESGLDMPRVNTIIVDHAYRFGLADLHQLRGRIGRSDIQGYAYFIVPSRRPMTPEANKRLSALASYTSLGSGFRLAIRDMEIRGVGNLLGKEQSGHINAIGYRLYMKILAQTVNQMQGKKIIQEPILDIKLDAYFPGNYIEKSYERTALYKRLLDIESSFELNVIKQEIVDRFGRYPEQVENLLTLAAVRLHARDLGASEVVRHGKQLSYYRSGKIIKKQRI